MKKLILVLVIFKTVGVSSLIYISLVGLKGFYREAFRQGLAVII